MRLQLIDKEGAADLASAVGTAGDAFDIAVSEDLCFGPGCWISLGRVLLRPGGEVSTLEQPYSRSCAVRYGGFEWYLPTVEDLSQQIQTTLTDLKDEYRTGVTKFFLQGLQDVLRRCLLLFPVFDASSFARMPLVQPTTVVPDTSAVQQGALDFVCRFLTPHARVKVPAIVHMEIVEQSDNYLKKIRWNSEAWESKQIRSKSHPNAKLKLNYRHKALDRHLLSQGGQRTLLRIELHSDVEIERGDLGADPLRGIVHPGSDSEDKALGLTSVTKSFADRLILETARRVQTAVRPGHPLLLLTSDQGMARMAMAEGMDVLYFHARSTPKFCGRTLTGALFHPFTKGLFVVSLIDVLWELAVAFGAVRLENRHSGASLELWGLGGSDEVTWQPLHARDDLLWGTSLIPAVAAAKEAVASDDQLTGTMPSATTEAPAASPQSLPLTGAYIFSPNKMLRLIGLLVARRRISKEELRHLLELQSLGGYREFENFLKSGRLVDTDEEFVSAKPELDAFWSSLRRGDMTGILAGLLRVPSFKALHDYIIAARRVPTQDSGLPISRKALPIYLRIGEAASAWLVVTEQGIAATDSRPSTEDFALIAVNTYEALRNEAGTDWVLTGAWLERLALQHAIHPVTAREATRTAMAEGKLRVYAEGSTPDTRFEKHTVTVLKSTGEALSL
jgi:hypothetical protein